MTQITVPANYLDATPDHEVGTPEQKALDACLWSAIKRWTDAGMSAEHVRERLHLCIDDLDALVDGAKRKVA